MLEELGERHPEIAVVVMSGRQDRKAIAAALDMGAAGFIPKTGNSKAMLDALRLVLGRGIYVPPQFQRDAAGFDQAG
jgi:DNA-binding NarL/FixJ family response regulator